MSRRQQPSLIVSTQEAVNEAIDFLREYEPAEGYFVGFSGGKDSICTLELCRMAGIKHQAWYSCTTIDPPEVVRFIRKHYPDVQWAYPSMSFWQGIQLKSPPLIKRRWCCDLLKKFPTAKVPLRHRVMGIRAEESFKRRQRARIERGSYGFVQQYYKPIFSWNEYHVWDFIDSNGLPYPSLYDEGFHRLGCVICPFLYKGNRRALALHKERWPKFYKTFELACRKWFETTNRGLKEENLTTFTQWFAAYESGFTRANAAQAVEEVA